jgi:hypothetical protein
MSQAPVDMGQRLGAYLYEHCILEGLAEVKWQPRECSQP